MVLTIHHLRVSTSERVIWLCEELGIPYELKSYDRSPLLAPPELKNLHPQGSAPVIQDGDLILAETSACVEYIAQKHGGGKLFLPPSHPNYADFLYWFHYSNGTLTPTVLRSMILKFAGVDSSNPTVQMSADRREKCLKCLNDRLKDNTWLAGDEFTAADVMTVFPLTTGRYFTQFSLAKYPNLVKYLGRVGERDAYKRAMEKGDPGLGLALGAESPTKPLV
ncbi:glutathione S-transferase family protein [Aspergillus stella-maris]|uniref:glutathione S-transferase family protein n=1 Tax=Aspergillus stella-maris TaxID=1810926 RepID=UPI003CCD3121